MSGKLFVEDCLAVELKEPTPNRDCDDLELTSLVEGNQAARMKTNVQQKNLEIWEETLKKTEQCKACCSMHCRKSLQPRGEITPRQLETHFR